MKQPAKKIATLLLFVFCGLPSFAPSASQAQTAGATVPYGNRMMSMAVVKPHMDDMRQMLIDLNTISSAQIAQFYETAMMQRFNSIVQNHQRIKDALPSVEAAKRDGNIQPDMRQAMQTLAQMNEQLLPKVAAQMDRVEKLNPNLKRYFDAVRAFNY
jgi:hypothetical protein